MESELVHVEVDGSAEGGTSRARGDGVRLGGMLAVPPEPRGVVVFAHGSGSSRHSPRNKLVARAIREQGRCGTLLIDLLSEQEGAFDARTSTLRFDLPLLARRVASVCDWVTHHGRTRNLPVGLFGASTGAAAALMVAAERPSVAAVVSRGGRPDLAGSWVLSSVHAPTLLIVGSEDEVVLDLNRQALEMLGADERKLEVVMGAGHLFAEPGTLAEAAGLAASWFSRYLVRR